MNGENTHTRLVRSLGACLVHNSVPFWLVIPRIHSGYLLAAAQAGGGVRWRGATSVWAQSSSSLGCALIAFRSNLITNYLFAARNQKGNKGKLNTERIEP